MNWEHIVSYLFSVEEDAKEIDDNGCVCGGKCACHLLGQIGGQSCPPNCLHYGDHFDGCHRCDKECQGEGLRK